MPTLIQRSMKPKLIIIASWGARQDPSSPLLRFVRDSSRVLKRYEIHCTGGTGRSILGTGLYTCEEVSCHRDGEDGGVVELAALVAQRQCETVIFLSDPSDLRSNVPENYAFQRMCKELQVRLITTAAGAELWAAYEATFDKEPELPASNLRRKWKEGRTNVKDGEPIHLPIEAQTLALISHDAKKEDMALFVSNYLPFLCRFDRVLTTGTTGFLLKMLFASKEQRQDIVKEAKSLLGEDRFAQLEVAVWETRLKYAPPGLLADLEHAAKESLGYDRNRELEEVIKRDARGTLLRKQELSDEQSVIHEESPQFVERVIPFPSGPKGGDILIAAEVLQNRCHAVVFFQDPGTAHPHDPDIRLFERTCQFWSARDKRRFVYATCISTSHAARRWATRLSQITEANSGAPPSDSHQLRRQWGLREVIIAEDEPGLDCELTDPQKRVGASLARACAGYFHCRLATLVSAKGRVCVGLAHGWTVQRVLHELRRMKSDKLLTKDLGAMHNVTWAALIGNVTVAWTDLEAAMIAAEFAEYYGGGKVRSFRSSGLLPSEDKEGRLRDEDRKLIARLEAADLILVIAAAWNRNHTLYSSTALDKHLLPPFDGEAVGTISASFINAQGKEVHWAYSEVGLDYAGLQKAAKRGAVVFICGGEERNQVLLAALQERLASVLVTTRSSAEWLLKHAQGPAHQFADTPLESVTAQHDR